MIHTRLPDEPVKTAREVVVLREFSVRELLAELTHLQDRINHGAASGGYEHAPGQTSRLAGLRRREHRVVAELRRRRRGDDPAPTSSVDPPGASEIYGE